MTEFESLPYGDLQGCPRTNTAHCRASQTHFVSLQSMFKTEIGTEDGQCRTSVPVSAL